MPELPEVETVKRGLEPALAGRRIMRVELRRQDLRFPFPADFSARLAGQRVESLSRRAKYILAHLQSGEALIMHLGMTGRFTVARPDGRSSNLGEMYFETGGEGPHDHVVFHLDDGARVIYSDPRRFGMMDLGGTDHKLLAGLGVEPLGNQLSADYLAQAFRGKSAPLKATLLDQRIIAGLGNIYVCEALFRARLSPLRKAGTLAGKKARKNAHDPRLDDLVRHIRDILTEAITAGGSTLQDYQGVDGAKGEYQQRFSAYDREGEPCSGCARPITRIVQSGRSTFFCRSCQK